MTSLSPQEIGTQYREGLEVFKNRVRPLIEGPIHEIRLESQFESLRDWSIFHSLEEIQKWFTEARQQCTMVVEEIPLKEVKGWTIDPQTGDVHHHSGEFFVVRGVRISDSKSREVGAGGWDQPILIQIGYDGGIVGILRKRFEGIPHYLIDAKAEPGNYERLQMSPTLQATFSNLKRAHGGRKPHFADFFEHPEDHGIKVLYKAWLSEDGGRLHLKRNLGMLIEVASDFPIEAPPGFRWMSLYQIKECLRLNAWVNPHIRGVIAHL